MYPPITRINVMTFEYNYDKNSIRRLAEAASLAMKPKQKIEELDESFEILEENLGNLNFIKNKGILSPFLNYQKKIMDGVGADSKVEDFSFKNSSNIEKALFERDGVVGVVLYIDSPDNQILSLARKDKSYKYSKYSGVGVTLTSNGSWNSNPKSSINSYFDNKTFKEITNSKSLDSSNINQYSYNTNTMAGAKKFLNDLIVFCRENNLNLGAKLIMLDEVRAKKRIERYNAKFGAISLIDPKKLGQQIASELKTKLDAYKDAKVSDAAKNPDDLKKLLDGAFPKKIAYLDYVYDFSEIRNVDYAIRAMVTGDKFYNEIPYVTYKMSGSSAEKREKDFKDLKQEIKSELGDDAGDEFWNVLSDKAKKTMPNEIKAIIEIQPNFSLKVVKIELGGGYL